MVYSLGLFLVPTSNRFIGVKILKVVEDVSKIGIQIGVTM